MYLKDENKGDFKKMFIPERLKELMDQNNLTQLALVEKIKKRFPECKIQQRQISDYLNGRAPRKDNLQFLADFFGVNIEYFSGRTNKPNLTIPLNSIPVVKSINYNNGIPELDVLEYVILPGTWLNNYDYFFVNDRVLKDPDANPGDYLTIKKSNTFSNGEVIICFVDGSLIIGKAYKKEGKTIITSGSDIYTSENVLIIGIANGRLEKWLGRITDN